jgi:hypothetical protein
MASAKKSPPAVTPTTVVDPFADSGMGPAVTTPDAGSPATIPASGGFVPSGPPSSDGKKYESAVGVEGSKVTPVDKAGKPSGATTYEGYMATNPIARKFDTYGRSVVPPFIPAMPKVEPRYFTSDVDALGSRSRGMIASWQSRLNTAGLLGNNFALGVVDNQTRSAYSEVLAIANREGVTDEEALAMVMQRQTTGGGTVQRYRLTNPTDLKVAIRAIAQDALGRGLDDGDVNRLVKLFQQEELSAQKKYQAGGAVTDAPSAQQFIQSKIQQDFGDEASTRKLDQLFQGIDQALGGKQ